MTVLEALKQSMDVLNTINVPVPQLETIGMPINQAMGLLKASVDALERNAKTEAAEEPEASSDESDPE